MRIPRAASLRTALALALLAGAGFALAQETVPANAAAEIASQLEKVRDLLREEGKWTEALNLLTPLLARLISIADEKQRITLSADVFLLRGIAMAGLGDTQAALREFRSLYALGPEIARAAVKNVFDSKVRPLLKQAERESRGEETGFFLAVVTDPAGAKVSVNGGEIGETPVLYQATGAEKVVVEVEKSGYRKVREEVEIASGGTRREYALVAEEMAVRVRSIPSGAKVILDGRDTGKTTEAELSGLTPGTHVLRLELQDCRPWEGALEIKAAEPRIEVERKLYVSVYTPETAWGGLESSLLKAPTALAQGPGGGFVVADASDVKVKVLNAEGRIVGGPDVATIAELGIIQIGGLAVTRNGRFLLSDSENHSVFLLNPDGRMVSRWGAFGSGPGDFNSPAGLALDENEEVYIADLGNDRIQIRSLEGIPLRTWGGPGTTGPVSFQGPRGLAVRDGKIYVLDSRRVHVFAKDGAPQASWEPRGPDGAPLIGAAALAVDAEGCVFLADPKGNRILKYDPAGEFVCAWGGPGIEMEELSRPCGLCIDSAGRIAVVETDNHRIQIFRAGRGAKS